MSIAVLRVSQTNVSAGVRSNRRQKPGNDIVWPRGSGRWDTITSGMWENPIYKTGGSHRRVNADYVFLDVTPCSLVHRCRSCGRTFTLHFLGATVGLFVLPEDGDGRFFWGIGTCVQNHTASHPRKHTATVWMRYRIQSPWRQKTKVHH